MNVEGITDKEWKTAMEVLETVRDDARIAGLMCEEKTLSKAHRILEKYEDQRNV
jgi:hypothetical protein